MISINYSILNLYKTPPNSWNLHVFNDLVKIRGGGTPSTKNNEFWNGDIAWITPKEVTSTESMYIDDTERKITEKALTSKSRLNPPGSVLLTSRAPVGDVIINTIPMATNQGFIGIQCGDRILNTYLYFWIRTNRKYLEISSNGTTFLELPKYVFRKLEILLPPLNEQKAIASILGSIEAKIENNTKLNETLEVMAQAIFRSWFIDFEPFQKDKFEDNEWRTIPEGWNVKKLSELCETKYGFTQSASKDEVGPKFLRITDIASGNIDWEDVPFCEISDSKKDQYKIQKGDILIARTGASAGSNVYIENCPEAIFASYLIRLKFKDLRIARYIGKFMQTSFYSNYITKNKTGSAQPQANARIVTGIDVIIPSDEYLDKYNSIIMNFEEKKYQNSCQNIILKRIRDILLPHLISGRLRISDPDKFLEGLNYAHQ